MKKPNKEHIQCIGLLLLGAIYAICLFFELFPAWCPAWLWNVLCPISCICLAIGCVSAIVYGIKKVRR